MAQDEDQLTERNVNVDNELPAKKYRLTMEVPLLITLLCIMLGDAPLSNIILYRTCVLALNFTTEECQTFQNPVKTNSSQHVEEQVQKYVTVISTVKILMESVVPAILSLFVGVWSDTHGRKPLVIWPILGMALSSMMVVVYALIDSLGPWWYLVTAVPFALSGGFTVMFTGAFCYMSDVSDVEDRSLRMTILEAAVSIGSILGAMSSSYILRAVGNVYLLLIVSTLLVIAYVYTNLCVRESLPGAQEGGLSSVLDISLVKEMVRESFKQRPNNGRAQILLLVVANSLSIFILYGLIGSQYLYVREKLHWAMKDYTIFSASSTAIAFVGNFAGILIVQKLLGVGDLPLAIIAFVSATIEHVIRAFAVQTWHMYLGSGIALFKGLSAPLIRSLLTKIMPVEHIAKLFCLMCALEAFCPLLAPTLYNSLYAFTISTFPGAVYLLSSFITTSCVVMLGIVLYFRRRPISSPIVYAHIEE